MATAAMKGICITILLGCADHTTMTEEGWIAAVERISKLDVAGLREFAGKHGCPGLGPWRRKNVLGGRTNQEKVRLLWSYVRVEHEEDMGPVLAVWVTNGNHNVLRRVRGPVGQEELEPGEDRRVLIPGTTNLLEIHARKLWERIGSPSRLSAKAMINMVSAALCTVTSCVVSYVLSQVFV